jgi:hypothetical protein
MRRAIAHASSPTSDGGASPFKSASTILHLQRSMKVKKQLLTRFSTVVVLVLLTLSAAQQGEPRTAP